MSGTILDIYLGSKELKKLIIRRSEDFEIPFRYICNDIKMDYKDFMQSYINSISNDSFSITEEQFERMLELLGIKLKHQFIIKSDYPAGAIREMLAGKYEKVIEVKEEQREAHNAQRRKQ